MDLSKKVTAHFFYRLLNKFSDISIPMDTGDFRLLDRRVVKKLKNSKEKNRYIRGLVSYVGFKQARVLFDRSERFAGKSHYTVSKMMKLAFDAMTSFSTKLLTGIIQVGLLLFIAGVLGLIFITSSYLFGVHLTISLLISMVTVGSIMTGIQLIMLGIIGLYVGRIYTEVQQRPLYIIESIYSEGNTSTVQQSNNKDLNLFSSQYNPMYHHKLLHGLQEILLELD